MNVVVCERSEVDFRDGVRFLILALSAFMLPVWNCFSLVDLFYFNFFSNLLV